MSILNDLIDAVAAVVKSRVEGVTQQVRKTGRSLPFCFVAMIMSLWGLGLLIAAVLIALAPHVGPAVAALISAGAAFFGAALFGLIAMVMKNKD
jgi:hypothetical protein